MSFYVKKRRTPIIPIVPLVDILTVLLIFFVVTTTFKKQTRNALLNIALPQASALTPAVESTPRTPLGVTAEGLIFLAEKPVPLGDLAAAITQFRQEQPAARLELKADEKAPLGTLVKVWDALAAAGLNINTDVPTKILLNQPPAAPSNQ
jgi:biopolymer transport protein ExbD